MDIYKTIEILHGERERLDKLIANLERLKASKIAPPSRSPQRRRGRKRMSAAEREAISARMKTYWAARRASAADAVGSPPEAPSPCTANAANA